MGYLYLAHHGVKGQKWGVRRYQNPDGSLIRSSKKGDSVYRMLHDVEVDGNGDGRKQRYVSTDTVGRMTYLGTTYKEMRESKETEYRLKKDLKIPDDSVAAKTFKNIYDKASNREKLELLEMCSFDYYKDRYAKTVGYTTTNAFGMKKKITNPKRIPDEVVFDKWNKANDFIYPNDTAKLRKFMDIHASKNTDAWKSYSKELEKQGYNAIKDYQDRSTNGGKKRAFSEGSTIILDYSSTLEEVKTRTVTIEEGRQCANYIINNLGRDDMRSFYNTHPRRG